jgi:LPS export ABC transporter protein LptC
MTRKFILVTIALVLAYVALIQWKLWIHVTRNVDLATRIDDAGAKKIQQVYSFSFSKYTETGERELEIEGDSADILAQKVKLINVIAKAYAEESPITITADHGTLDKSTSDILLRENVVATTENGARLLTEELLIHPEDKKMETEIEATVKKDNIHVEGLGASSDSGLGKVTFQKNVTVVVQDPNSQSNNPTVITCDGPLIVDYKRSMAHFKKNVVAQDERGTLTSDYMDVFYSGTSRRIYKMVARGNVVVTTKEGNKTYSDNAIYLAEEGRVILGGDVDATYRNEETFDHSDGLI